MLWLKLINVSKRGSISGPDATAANDTRPPTVHSFGYDSYIFIQIYYFEGFYAHTGSSHHSAAYMRQLTGSALVHVMAYRRQRAIP